METGIKIRKIKSHGREKWEADIPAHLTGKKRQRPTFDSETAAETHAMKFYAQVKEHGTRSLENKGITVREALKKFWKLRDMDGRHLQEAEHILNLFEKDHGQSPLELIAPIDLLGFWKQKRGKNQVSWGPTTQEKAFRYLRLFFNWCERYDLVIGNPSRRVEPPKAGDPRKNILTPEAMADFLKVDDVIFHAFLCLGGLVGLRTCEFANKLTKKKIPALLPEHIEKTEIRVNADHKEERWVARTEAFDRHWQGLPEFPAYPVDFYTHIRSVIGGKWSPNCLRHSFGTYHLALYENAPATAHQMGNSEYTVKKNYAKAARKAAAEKWRDL